MPNIIVTGLNQHYNPEVSAEAKKHYPSLWKSIVLERTKGVQFPCVCPITDYGTSGIPIVPNVLLPNGKTLSTKYLQIAD